MAFDNTPLFTRARWMCIALLALSLAYARPATACDPGPSGTASGCGSGWGYVIGGTSAAIGVGVSIIPLGFLIHNKVARPTERPNKAAAIVGLVTAPFTLLAAGITYATISTDPPPSEKIVTGLFGTITLATGVATLALGIDGVLRADEWDATHPEQTSDQPTSFKLPPPRVTVAPIVSAQQQGLALVVAGW